MNDRPHDRPCDQPHDHPHVDDLPNNPEAEFVRMSRRAFVTFGASAIAGISGWTWLRTRSNDGEIPWPLRRVLSGNDRLSRATKRTTASVATFSASAARELRANGDDGLTEVFDPATWTVRIELEDKVVNTIGVAELGSLQQRTQTVLHKCIEGWSTPVTWSGPRLSEVVKLVRAQTNFPNTNWVGLRTNNGGYYVSLDWDAAMHPQALLATRLNGESLTAEHGAPVRLAMPTHYGVKSIKQVAVITFTNSEPPDFWAERGYDKDMSF